MVSSAGGRGRVVHLTPRGRAAYGKIHEILRDIEREWSTELGPTQFTQLKELLLKVWDSSLIK
jgi:DNA-binding MarR family transcriptional regulator